MTRYIYGGTEYEREELLDVLVEELDEAGYDDWLDEIGGDVTIAGLTYSTSYALKMVDPIAYRCGMGDYRDVMREGLEDELDWGHLDLVEEIDEDEDDEVDEDEDDEDDA